ncbi:hypothetical protein D6858_09355 [Tsuneonella suprasediminis]|uniref:Uncharacterized protein n=1 Tax=Tsuneonella suprasediminis TaxID=2306996 RepID=A0A419R310_9SPHN|nr:hypothetical protein [Tsuneonella suprasediminis]RJX68113.1 hypothetical protein D6858_09355 [Tsuneonella suprasediminis]
MQRIVPLILSLSLFALAGCSASGGNGNMPGDTEDWSPYAGIGENETVRFTGTEPFWGGTVAGQTLIYSTPESTEGKAIGVERFAGRGGISWSGMYGGAPLVLAVTPGKCSDGMSDRSYPFVATLQVAGEQRNGCAWSDKKPFSGPEHP